MYNYNKLYTLAWNWLINHEHYTDDAFFNSDLDSLMKLFKEVSASDDTLLKDQVIKYYLGGEWCDKYNCYIARIDELNVAVMGKSVEEATRLAYYTGIGVLKSCLDSGESFPPTSKVLKNESQPKAT